MTSPPDLVEAQRFLDLLEAEGVFTFQTFSDSDKARGGACFPRVFHGRLSEHGDNLASLNEAGAGIFVMVNAGDGVTHPGEKTCRAGVNVVRVRALFLDLDGSPIAPPLSSALPPDWVVQSSPGRWHTYWLVDECPLDDFTPTQTALARRFRGDPNVKDLPRVMRIPGFVHRKETPFLSELYLPTDYPNILETQHDY
jgi:hypothetical protein